VSERELAYDDVLALLAEGDIEVDGRMPWSSNRTFLAHLSGAESSSFWPASVIYKPAAGERPLWDFGQHTLCRREVAAAVVSEALSWRIVPPTILRDGPYGEGMVQLFVHHDPDEHFFTLREDEANADRFRFFAAFDIVINNADRKSGHCLQAADGVVWGIDHGLSFHSEPKLRTVIWDYVGEPIVGEVADDLCRLDHELSGSGELLSELRGLLTVVEIDALRGRIERLVRAGRFPEPFTDYPYPWPMV
jgi:uncharacterized repeat protein (TIGR03843 family)